MGPEPERLNRQFGSIQDDRQNHSRHNRHSLIVAIVHVNVSLCLSDSTSKRDVAKIPSQSKICEMSWIKYQRTQRDNGFLLQLCELPSGHRFENAAFPVLHMKCWVGSRLPTEKTNYAGQHGLSFFSDRRQQKRLE